MGKSKRLMMDKRALDTLTDKSESFEIENAEGKKETLYLYPLQLGRLALISQRLIDLDIATSEDAGNEVQKMWSICAEKPRAVAEIIAIATLRTKKDIDEKLAERTDLIYWSPSMNTVAYSNLLYAIVFQSYYEDFMSAIRSVKTLQVTISQMTATERIASTEEGVSGDR